MCLYDDGVPTITLDHLARARLREMARVAFDLKSGKRDARRRRWAEENRSHELISAVTADFLRLDSKKTIHRRYNLTMTEVRRIIAENLTAQQILERKREFGRRREKRNRDKKRPNRKLRTTAIPTLGYPSINQAALAMGIRPGTLYMRIDRERARSARKDDYAND